VELVWPARCYLPGYVDALQRGWSPDTSRADVAQQRLAEIEADADAVLRSMDDRDSVDRAPVELPDGTLVDRIPGYRRWMWDGEFCGSIGYRRLPGTTELPSHVLGHVGYTVVPWKRRRGYATRALGLLVAELRDEDLDYVEFTTDPDNVGSRRVIEANGGVFVEQFRKHPAYGESDGLRFRISLR
jgi:predicted acetyltransferase